MVGLDGVVVNFVSALKNHAACPNAVLRRTGTKHDSRIKKRGGKEMKKFTVLCLAGLLILAFGATAYAQAPKLDFRASGFIDTQTFLGENVPHYNNDLG